MTDRAWTPGPWRVCENNSHSMDECNLSICGDIFILADISGPMYAHCEPNAHLIAAAPDLYEALEAARQHVLWICEENERLNKNPSELDRADLVKIDAALAKARGQS